MKKRQMKFECGIWGEFKDRGLNVEFDEGRDVSTVQKRLKKA